MIGGHAPVLSQRLLVEAEAWAWRHPAILFLLCLQSAAMPVEIKWRIGRCVRPRMGHEVDREKPVIDYAVTDVRDETVQPRFKRALTGWKMRVG
jgi:hypothetical protein